MLRLHGSRLLDERVLTFKREDGFAGHALGLIPRSVSGIVVIGEMDEISFIRQAIFMSSGLDPVDRLD